jgi:hypothetical protein
MKRLVPFILASVVLPAAAVAQPGYSAPPANNPGGYYSQPQPVTPGGFWDRSGRMVWGLGLGLGSMSSKDGPIECQSCSFNEIAVEFHVHLGGMLSPRLALMAEVQGNVQTVEEVAGGEGTKTLLQGALMVAAQYWLTPRLWLKGGVGFAHLSYNYNDAYGSQDEPLDDGGAVLLGVGYEIASGRDLAIDLQGRYIVGSYDGIDEQISSGTIGIGINWY